MSKNTTNVGWAYYKSGSSTSSRKIHYLSNLKSKCGLHTVSIEKQNSIRFVDKSELSLKRICKQCERVLDAWSEDQTTEEVVIHG